MALHPFDPTPKAVLFDLDDTLCDYVAAREARLRIAFSLSENGIYLENSGRDIDAMIAESILTHPHGVEHFEELFRRHGVIVPEIAQQAARWYRSNRFIGLRLFPNAKDVLRAVRTTDEGKRTGGLRPVGIITNGPTDVQRAKIDLLGIRELIDFAIISEEFGSAKPSPDIFKAALRRAGVAASEAVFVGDSPEFDIVGAGNLGMRSIWVSAEGATWELAGTTPDRQVHSISEVPALVGASG